MKMLQITNIGAVTLMTIFVAVKMLPANAAGGGELTLESPSLRLTVSASSGSLTRFVNKLTGETVEVAGDEFAVGAREFTIEQRDCRMSVPAQKPGRICLEFTHDRLTAEVEWRLGEKQAFAEKRMTVTFRNDAGWTRMVVSRPVLAAAGLKMVCYRYPSFARLEKQHGEKRPPDTEPNKTYFGRTPAGGCCLGLEMPFDSSTVAENRVELSYAPSLKVKAGERFECEPMYLGAYKRGPMDARTEMWRPTDEVAAGATKGAAPADAVLPLPSESAAMVAMTSAVLGPPRHGLKAFACGWHCQMTQGAYTRESLEADLKALAFLKECGLDGLTDSHPWGGETAKMNALGEGDRYTPGPEVRRFLDRAGELGLIVSQWSSMNNTHPWMSPGAAFRPDNPQWFRGGSQRNCLACEPFFDWLLGIERQALETKGYGSWVVDGDFWGGGGYYNTTVPVTCTAGNHRHLPPDSNYACQQALARMAEAVRRAHPDIYITMCRPPCDLGVWALRQVDACFTLIEWGTGENLGGGDQIRTASRIRVQHHFFPHTLDWPLLFPSFGGYGKTVWPRGHLDYILLSALSSSPNLLMYLPARTGIPEEDKAEIRKWLEWGRRNEAFLKARRDLFDWPGPDRVDGSAHIVGDRGLVFLFNPGRTSRSISFALGEADIGLVGSGRFVVSQEHPTEKVSKLADYGATVTWEVPAESAAVLRIGPARN